MSAFGIEIGNRWRECRRCETVARDLETGEHGHAKPKFDVSLLEAAGGFLLLGAGHKYLSAPLFRWKSGKFLSRRTRNVR